MPACTHEASAGEVTRARPPASHVPETRMHPRAPVCAVLISSSCQKTCTRKRAFLPLMILVTLMITFDHLRSQLPQLPTASVVPGYLCILVSRATAAFASTHSTNSTSISTSTSISISISISISTSTSTSTLHRYTSVNLARSLLHTAAVFRAQA